MIAEKRLTCTNTVRSSSTPTTLMWSSCEGRRPNKIVGMLTGLISSGSLSSQTHVRSPSWVLLYSNGFPQSFKLARVVQGAKTPKGGLETRTPLGARDVSRCRNKNRQSVITVVNSDIGKKAWISSGRWLLAVRQQYHAETYFHGVLDA